MTSRRFRNWSRVERQSSRKTFRSIAKFRKVPPKLIRSTVSEFRFVSTSKGSEKGDIQLWGA